MIVFVRSLHSPFTSIGIITFLGVYTPVPYPGFFLGVQKIQLRTEGRQNGDLGAVAP
jgi:hypothetical protein